MTMWSRAHRAGCVSLLLLHIACGSWQQGCLAHTIVSTSQELLTALSQPDVTHITLQGNIRINEKDPFPVFIQNRSVLLEGPGTPSFSGATPLNREGSAALDFNSLFPVIIVDGASRLTMQNMEVLGIPSPTDPAVEGAPVSELPFANRGFALWPSVLMYPGTMSAFTNFLQTPNRGFRDCAEETLASEINKAAVVLNGPSSDGGYQLDPPAIFLKAPRSFNTPVIDRGTGVQAGSAAISINGISALCFVEGTQLPAGSSQGSSSGGLSTGAWVGIAAGVTAALAIFIIALFTLRKRRQRRASIKSSRDSLPTTITTTSLTPPSSPTWSVDRASAGRMDLETYRKEQSELALSHTVTFRFGELQGLEMGRLIGIGAHGRVYRGSLRGAPVAIKVAEHGSNDTATAAITAEAAILTTLSHPNILRVYRVITVDLQQRGSGGLEAVEVGGSEEEAGSPKSVAFSVRGSNSDPATPAAGVRLKEMWLILEYCDRGCLSQALVQKRLHTKEGAPKLPLIVNILIDVALGMCYLHEEAGHIHGDLKLANILLKSGSQPGSLIAVVADFGLSKALDIHDPDKSVMRTRALGTVPYLSPELVQSGRLTKAADVWAFGVCMWELYSGELAYDGLAPAAVYYAITAKSGRLELPEGCPAEYAAVVEACMRAEPKERCGFKWILEQLTLMKTNV